MCWLHHLFSFKRTMALPPIFVFLLYIPDPCAYVHISHQTRYRSCSSLLPFPPFSSVDITWLLPDGRPFSSFFRMGWDSNCNSFLHFSFTLEPFFLTSLSTSEKWWLYRRYCGTLRVNTSDIPPQIACFKLTLSHTT